MSLLKVNEVQNYNGSSLTLTASTVSTSAQLNTGGNISVTGSINVSDDSTTRSNLGLGSIATQDSSNVSVTGGSITGTTIVPTSPFSFRNRIINGDMRIDQRNAGVSVTPVSGDYTLDRWAVFGSQSSKFTIQQNAGSVTTPNGFSNYLGLTVAASANVSVGAGDYFLIDQTIEGFNFSDLSWGTANAKSVILSFYVRSSVTGTFGGAIKSYSGSSYGYPFTYNISSANTWEKKNITITGPTATWSASLTNGGSAEVIFSVGTGSSFYDTAGSWYPTTIFSASGATNLIETNGATLYITGVQLEEGTVPTPFEHRPIGLELSLCQRYYFRTSEGIIGTGWNNTTSQAVVTTNFPTPMRTKPTALEQSGTASDYNVRAQNSAVTCASVPVFSGTTNKFLAVSVFTTAAATLNAGEGSAGAVSTNGFLAWSAEL